MEGFPAIAMTGNNSPVFPDQYARWYPLVNTYDRYGRKRGSVFSLVFHHDGPFKGSAWAFSGVTNVNLFSTDHPHMLQSLLAAIQGIRNRLFLVSLERDYKNQEMEFIATVANYGEKSQDAELCFLIEQTALAEKTISLEPKSTQEFRQSTSLEDIPEQFSTIDVKLQAGLFHDSLISGVCQFKPTRLSESTFKFQKNYFEINNRPTFLLGTNQTGMIWYSPKENPATWEQDFTRMRDFGLRMLRVLHFSPFAAKGYEGRGGHSSLDLAKDPPARLIRQTDELVAMCARHGIALMLTLHDWLGINLSREEQDAQQKWAQFWADRYKEQSHVFFDIQNEPSVQLKDSGLTRQKWNDFLRSRYTNDTQLREAWGNFAPQESLGNIPCEPGRDVWENPRRVDYNYFRVQLLESWIDANLQGIRIAAPNMQTTVGFLQFHTSAEKLFATHRLDFVNSHYHGPIQPFASITKYIDRRFKGQGLGVGEFEAWDAHEARTHGRFADETQNSIRHFLAVGHDTFGMGGSFALNWDLKDFEDCLFPWGLTYAHDNVPKDWFHAYRNMSLFFRSIQPKYNDPGLYLLIPDSHRMGGQMNRIYAALDNALNMLFACHVDFNVINERSLADLPASTRTILWPVPYCPTDNTFSQVLKFVKNGGNLYLSGDVSFDEFRNPTRRKRLLQLGLPSIVPSAPFEVEIPATLPDFITSTVGKGRVFYIPVPLELKSGNEWDKNPYMEFLNRVNEGRILVNPDDPRLHLFSISLDNANKVYTLYRNQSSESPKPYNIETIGGKISIALEGFQSGLVEIDRKGHIFALGGSGKCGNDAFSIDISGHSMIRSLDNKPINQSRILAVFPTEKGAIRLPSTAITSPFLTVGEIENGKWITYEKMDLADKNKTIPIQIDEDRTTSILLISDKDQQEKEQKKPIPPR